MLKIEQLSYWERKSYFENVEFLIIGAGIVGYSTALHLRKKYPDARILILERGYLPSGASTKNAGFACFGSATELLDDLKHIEEDLVWKTVARRWEGLQYLKEIIGIENLELETNGSWDLIRESQKNELPIIRDKIHYLNDTIHRITGFSEVYYEDGDLRNKFGFEGLSGSFHNRLEGQINTGKMMKKYHQIIIDNNIEVLFGISVETFNNEQNSVEIETNIGPIKAGKLLICTNGFASQLVDEEVSPARAQVLVTSKIPNLKIKGTFHYDCGYYYFRNIDDRILLGGGRNIDFMGETTSVLDTTDNIMNALEELISSVILPNEKINIDYRWSGIMGVGETKAPIVKKINPAVGIGVRLGGMGVAIGTDVGKELADLF